MSQFPLINATAVKRLTLEVAQKHRPFNKFSRVSTQTLILANDAVRYFIVNHVKTAPSKGKTL